MFAGNYCIDSFFACQDGEMDLRQNEEMSVHQVGGAKKCHA